MPVDLVSDSAKGKYPSDVWQVGEVVVDSFKIWIPPNYGPKRLGLWSGLYKGNYRVPVTSAGRTRKTGDNSVVFPTVNEVNQQYRD